jgi:TorA maturation chaperone TorD
MGPGTPAPFFMVFHVWQGNKKERFRRFGKMDRSIARSLIYNRLSLCYVYPDEKVYASIAAGEWIREVRETLRLLDGRNFDEYLRAIEQAIAGAKDGEQLAMIWEYTRLFINAFPHVIAPPYGSFYLEKEGLVSAKATSEVLHFYHEAGFTLKEDLRDLPDHITHELEFMGILASEEGQAMGNEKIKLEEIQMNFLSRFILPWVPAFCNTVVEHSPYPFYHHLGNLTKEFINFEKNYLGIPEELNFRKENESETIGG